MWLVATHVNDVTDGDTFVREKLLLAGVREASKCDGNIARSTRHSRHMALKQV